MGKLAASQIDTPLEHAQEEAMPLVKWALTPMGHCNPKEEYANVMASTNHLEILCFVTAHELPSLPLYAFPPVALLPQVLRRVRKQRHKLILIAPLWRNQPWVSELFQLLKAARWLIPLRRDLLSQANGTIWHPRPRLWALHLWPLDGSLPSSHSVS